ncbi:MAG: ATP synthase F1 subunit gamma [Verrucomicrobiota bacterium]
MPSTRDIRRRIKSVKNTAQITKAMQMVSASKMRKAQQSALAGRPYAEVMNDVLSEIAAVAGESRHALMEQRSGKRRGVILVTSDKGLCGALNSNILREASKFDRDTTLYITAGRKAAQFVARTRRQLKAEFTYKDTPQFSEARAISKFARELFLSGEVDRVDVLFTNFISTLNLKPVVIPLLPVGEIKGVSSDVKGEAMSHELTRSGTEFIFEPSLESVMEAMLPHYLNFQVYQVLLEARASEQSARMVAMKNATDNAQQLIKDLTLEYNKMRQAAITKELLEISSAAMALG